jgi:hypothetical protein
MEDAGTHHVHCWEQKKLMKRLTRWVSASLAAATLLTLMLALSGLMLSASAASAAAPFRPLPRPPTATPTTQPTSTPTPRPTATAAPSPTATATATATTAPTSTALPTTSTGETTAASPGASQTAASSLQPLLLWGIAAMIAALLIFGTGIWLFARRARRQGQQHPAFASYAHLPSPERLNQLHQLLPTRKASSPMPQEDGPEAAETLIAEEDTSQPLSSPPPGLPWSSSPKPPQWLIDAGFWKGSAQENPPEAPEKP